MYINKNFFTLIGECLFEFIKTLNLQELDQ